MKGFAPTIGAKSVETFRYFGSRSCCFYCCRHKFTPSPQSMLIRRAQALLKATTLNGGGKNRSARRKTFGARMRTNNKLNPHMASPPGIEPRSHWWEASAQTTAPSLLLLVLAWAKTFLSFPSYKVCNLHNFVVYVIYPTRTFFIRISKHREVD